MPHQSLDPHKLTAIVERLRDRVQKFDDAVVLASVNEVETLTTGLSRKIWQKLMILEMGSTAATPVPRDRDPTTGTRA